jgi:endoglycosylceramidase
MRTLLLVLAAGCGAAPKGQPVDSAEDAGPPAVLRSEDGRLLDADGRQVLLRGINARVDGLFDVTFDDGRVALEEIPPFTRDDCGFLSRELGLNLLRLPVQWSGIEPDAGSYDDDYLDRIGQLVDDCAAVGVVTIVDLHQDAYGKDIGEDGAPLWAIVPAPPELLEGPLTSEELARRRLSGPVLAAFRSLYGDAALPSGRTLHQAHAQMAGRLAASLVDHPGAVALELHNEPVTLGDQTALDAFHAASAAAVRGAHPTLPVVFEPDALRNLTDAAPVETPFPFANTIYGPHIYTDVFENGWADEDTDAIRASIAAAQDEATAHGAHLFVGEFGNDPRTERGALYIDTCLDAFDAHQASWAIWLYEEHSQDSWGLWDEGAEPHTRGSLREDAADQLARPFPTAIDGQVEAIAWDGQTQTLTVSISGAGGGSHEVSAPLRTWPDGVAVTCDAVPVPEVEVADGRARFVCEGSELRVFPADG